MVGIQTQISPKGERLPRIIIKQPQETSRLFPWQTAYLANSFVREQSLRRFRSRYVDVDGVAAHELIYTPRDDSPAPIEKLQYSQVSVIRGKKEYLFVMAAENIEPHLETFERFLASVRSK